MAKTPKNSATAPVASNTTAVQPQNDDGVTTSLSSTPSGSNGPDGTNTGPAASGSVSDQKQDGEGHDQTDGAAVAASVAPSSEPSQGDVSGAGANAGSVSNEITAVLKVDASIAAETLRLAAIGGKLLEMIVDVARDYPDLQEWIGSDDPAGIVRELVEENAVLKEWRDKKRASAGDDEKRYFDITASVRLDGELFEVGKELPLTRNQHKDIAAAGGCDPDWENGE
ncbi:hypothetical protein G6M16_007045 [Agrobacterium tumefaciens]|nr:hypothetical protein G6M16_007045 [Agrobacterium tumefaciens]